MGNNAVLHSYIRTCATLSHMWFMSRLAITIITSTIATKSSYQVVLERLLK